MTEAVCDLLPADEQGGRNGSALICDESEDNILIAKWQDQINHPHTNYGNTTQLFKYKNLAKIHRARYLQLFMADNEQHADSADRGGIDYPSQIYVNHQPIFRWCMYLLLEYNYIHIK